MTVGGIGAASIVAPVVGLPALHFPRTKLTGAGLPFTQMKRPVEAGQAVRKLPNSGSTRSW